MIIKENAIIREIYRYGRKKQSYILAGNIVLFALIFILLWLSVTLADSIFYFSEVTRWGLFFINIPLLLFLVFRFIITPLRNWLNYNNKNDLSDIALEIGKKDPQIADRLVNVYQLQQQPASPLLQAAIDQLSAIFKKSIFHDKIDRKTYFPGARLFVPILVSAFLILALQPRQIYRSSLRLLNPANNYVIVPPYQFAVTPGNKELLYGEPLEVAVDFSGPEIADMKLLYLSEGRPDVRVVDMELRKKIYLTRFKEITSSFSYQMVASPSRGGDLEGKLISDTFRVNVLIPPQIKELALNTISPRYSGLAESKNENNNGNIVALKGTKVEVAIVSNKILKKAKLVFSSADTISLATKGKRATGSFRVKEAGSYAIHLMDTENLQNQDPIVYSLSTLSDNPPYVEISEPGSDVEARLDDIMNVKVAAADDYGLSDVFLMYRYIKQNTDADSSWQRLNIEGFRQGSKKGEYLRHLNFSNFFVGYNDQIEYYAAAVDNNSVSGFSKSSSPVYRIIFPSMDELFNEFAADESEKIEDMERMADESKELKEKLEEINRELKRSEKLDWETKKQLENTLNKQKEAQEKIEKIQQELEEMINKLDQNDLINPEIMEKYSQLQELFQEIATPELMDAMKKLQQTMENANPHEVQKALENFKLNQEAFQQNLERTLELFKQVQLEQKLDQMIKQAAKLQENQKEIGEQIENDKKPNEQSNSLENQQKLQKELLESLKRNLENMLAQERLNEFRKAKEQLEETQNAIDQQKLAEQLQELSEQLRQQNKSDASVQSQKLQKSFRQLQQNLNMAMQNLRQQHKQNVQKKMLSATQKMLKLSHEQEKIEQKTRDASQINDDLREMARQQANLQNNLSKLLSDLIQLSKETFFINPDMNKNMASAFNNMQKSLDNLSERRNSQAASDQQKAMEALNRGISSMQQSMSQMSASQSGTGFEQFMQQLQQMAGAQGGVNDETMNFFQGQGNNGQMSIQQQAQRQRLAAQQKAIQQALDEMTGNMGNRSDVLGRLNEMGEQMDEIIQDMLADNISRKTIQRQQQILSRMLDAQKSVREREFSRKRKAEQARQYIAKDPGELKEFEEARQKQLQEALRKALSEGYYDDYQKLIEAYFKKLTESELQKSKN